MQSTVSEIRTLERKWRMKRFERHPKRRWSYTCIHLLKLNTLKILKKVAQASRKPQESYFLLLNSWGRGNIIKERVSQRIKKLLGNHS